MWDREQNLIIRGDCQALYPMFNWEKTNYPYLLSSYVTTELLSEAAPPGFPLGIKITKVAPGGVQGSLVQVATNETWNMHGLTPGLSYIMRIKANFPTAGGVEGPYVNWVMADYVGGWVEQGITMSDLHDCWQIKDRTITIRSNATGFFSRLYMGQGYTPGVYYYLGSLEFIPVLAPIRTLVVKTPVAQTVVGRSHATPALTGRSHATPVLTGRSQAREE